MRVAAVVLAAGASRRMGRDKMLEPVRGEPLVCSAVRAAAEGGCDPTVVVTGANEGALRQALTGFAIRFVPNRDPETPPGSSFQVGLQSVRDADAAILILGDMVDLTADMVRQIRRAAEDPETAIVLSEYAGVVAPPYLVARSLFAEVLAAGAQQVVRRLADRYAARVRTLRWPSARMTDVDTPEDLDALRQKLD